MTFTKSNAVEQMIFDAVARCGAVNRARALTPILLFGKLRVSKKENAL